MVITPGQPGRNDWMYTMNPMFTVLTGRKDYSAGPLHVGIGSDAKKGDEKVYIMPTITIEEPLGLDISQSGRNKEDRATVANSNLVTSSYFYKWAIAHISLAKVGTSTGEMFVIFYNENNIIKRFTYQIAGMYPFTSLYKATGTAVWNYGSTGFESLFLSAGFSIADVASDYQDLMFECVDLEDGDAGYDAMIEYLLNEEAFPPGKGGGGGGGGSTPSDNDPYSNLIPPSYPTPRQPDTPGRPDVPILLPELPDASHHAINTGFLTLYAPSIASMQGLATKLWSDDFFDNIIKNFQSPFDAILSLGLIPFTVTGTNQVVKIGNWSSQNLYMPKVSNQYRIVDLGTVVINEATGSYMDYSPYTRITLYLPYIGFVPLNADEVMRKTLGVVYYVDLLTGACVAYITVDGYVHSQYSGNVMVMIPLSGRDSSSLYQSAISIGLSAIGTVATGGLTSALSAGALAASASTVMSSKDKVMMGGSVQGSSGPIGLQYPYMIIESPRACLPNNQNSYTGYPSFITTKLGSLSGYTEVDSIHLEGISCTESELKEIEQLLKEGVML